MSNPSLHNSHNSPVGFESPGPDKWIEIVTAFHPKHKSIYLFTLACFAYVWMIRLGGLLLLKGSRRPCPSSLSFAPKGPQKTGNFWVKICYWRGNLICIYMFSLPSPRQLSCFNLVTTTVRWMELNVRSSSGCGHPTLRFRLPLSPAAAMHSWLASTVRHSAL